MTKRKVYLGLMAAVCVALAAWMALSAVAILREGSARRAANPMESVYTPRAAAEKFAPIAPLCLAGLGLLTAGLALGVKDEGAEGPARDAMLARDLLSAHVAQPSEAMRAERRRQSRLAWIGRGLFGLSMVPVLVYLLDPAHFPEADPEGMFFGLTGALLPWTALGLGALSVCAVLAERSALREAQAARERLAEERAAGITVAVEPVKPMKKAAVPRLILIVAAIACIVAGALNGSARDVLYKAITICTECVGLG